MSPPPARGELEQPGATPAAVCRLTISTPAATGFLVKPGRASVRELFVRCRLRELFDDELVFVRKGPRPRGKNLRAGALDGAWVLSMGTHRSVRFDFKFQRTDVEAKRT